MYSAGVVMETQTSPIDLTTGLVFLTFYTHESYNRLNATYKSSKLPESCILSRKCRYIEIPWIRNNPGPSALFEKLACTTRYP